MRYILVLVMLVVAASAASAQQPQAAVVPQSITVGDVFHAAVRMPLPEGARVQVPDSIGVIEDVEQAGRYTVRVDSSGPSRVATIAYPLAAWRPGD